MLVPILLVLCAGFFAFDRYVDSSSKVRAFFMNVTAPVYWVADIPNKVARWNDKVFVSKARLQDEKTALERKVLLLEGRLQKMAQLEMQNTRLRNLLKSSLILQEDVLVAEVVGVSPSRSNRFMIINKGLKHDVSIGQSVIDSQGLLGQVVEVNSTTSRVLTLTDEKHAVPVQVNRSGVRGIVQGQSKLQELELIQIPLTADIVEGDLLITSGIGGHYPRGYPVGRVTKIEQSDDQFFYNVKAKPLAGLNNSRFVLLVERKSNAAIKAVVEAQQENLKDKRQKAAKSPTKSVN